MYDTIGVLLIILLVILVIIYIGISISEVKYKRKKSNIILYEKHNEDYIIENEDKNPKEYTCKNCGEDVSEDDKFCPKCGLMFVDDNEYINSIETNEYTCDNCGEQVSEEDNFCQKCGYKLVEEDEELEKNKYSLHELFSIYVKCIIIELIMSDIDYQNERINMNHIPLRDEFSITKTLGKPRFQDVIEYLKNNIDEIRESNEIFTRKDDHKYFIAKIDKKIIDYFNLLYDCNTIYDCNYHLNERLKYYKKKKEEYLNILYNNLKLYLSANKLFTEYKMAMINEIDYTINSHKYYTDMIKNDNFNKITQKIKKIFHLTNENEGIDAELIEPVKCEFYEELYNYLVKECKLTRTKINNDMKKAETNINKKVEEYSNKKYLVTLRNPNDKVFNYIECDVKTTANSINIFKYCKDEKKIISDTAKLAFLDNIQKIINNSSNQSNIYLVTNNNKFVYYEPNDNSFYYCDYPAFFISVINEENSFTQFLKASNALSELIKENNIDTTRNNIAIEQYTRDKYDIYFTDDEFYGCDDNSLDYEEELEDHTMSEIALGYWKTNKIDIEFEEY